MADGHWRGVSRLLTASGAVENDPPCRRTVRALALSIQQADYDLYQFSLDHPSPSVALATSRNEMDPAWSAPGRMAFTTDRAGRDEIWLRSQKGDFERPLVTPCDFGASETYLLSAPAIRPTANALPTTEWVRKATASGSRRWRAVLPVQLAPGDLPQDWPSWSPDGAWVAYVE